MKLPKLYYFKTIRNLLFVHKHGKTFYEDLFDDSAPIFTTFTANKELKQPFSAIIRETPTLYILKRTIRKSSKSALCYNNSSTTHRLILSGNIETYPGPVNPDNQQVRPKYDCLISFTRQLCNNTVRINFKRLMCIYCRSLVHLQCSTLKVIFIIKTLVKLMNE